ncbi:MAG: acyltransferase [Acetatifactor sp.]|nr:acyltransferase [Acetatifactor sp.]
MSAENKQILWLNCSKTVAVLAVLVDHTNGVLYTNQDIAYASYFSVSLFIIISGMTSYFSNLYSEKSSGGGYIEKCKKIVLSYSIAIFIHMIVITNSFDLQDYIYYLIHFNISGPHYFVLLYIQLMLFNSFLYSLLKKCPCSPRGYCYEVLVTVCIIVLSIWTTNHTNMLDVYGGGGKLFGGTYLVLYFFGMLVVRHNWLKEISLAKSGIMVIVFGTIWFWLWRFVCRNGLILEKYVTFGDGFNPPGITFTIFAFCMLFMTFGTFTLLEQIKCLSWISLLTGWLGKHTLYVFLYHKLILDFFLLKFISDLPDINIWLARFVFFFFMIAGSIVLEVCVSFIQKFIRCL